VPDPLNEWIESNHNKCYIVNSRLIQEWVILAYTSKKIVRKSRSGHWMGRKHNKVSEEGPKQKLEHAQLNLVNHIVSEKKNMYYSIKYK
jgi:hypothetical protein